MEADSRSEGSRTLGMPRNGPRKLPLSQVDCSMGGKEAPWLVEHKHRTSPERYVTVGYDVGVNGRRLSAPPRCDPLPSLFMTPDTNTENGGQIPCIDHIGKGLQMAYSSLKESVQLI